MQKDFFQGVFFIVKGVLISLLCALFFTVVFACILRACNLPKGAVYPTTQAIKALSVCIGALFCVRGEKGWLKGSLLGLVFTMLSYITFSTIGGDFSLSWLILLEVLLGVVAGALSGIIAVNLRQN